MNTKFEKITIPFSQLSFERETMDKNKLYSHPVFIRKFPKDVEFLSDYSIDEKLIELEFKDGNRAWINMELIFGKVLLNASIIYLEYAEDRINDYLKIHSIEEIKIKRTKYLKLIFIADSIPF